MTIIDNKLSFISAIFGNRLKEGSKVTLSIDSFELKTQVDSKDITIWVSFQPKVIEIPAGQLYFKSEPSDFSFEPIEYSYQDEVVTEQAKPFNIEIFDSRNSGGWDLRVKSDSKLINGNDVNDSFVGALKYDDLVIDDSETQIASSLNVTEIDDLSTLTIGGNGNPGFNLSFNPTDAIPGVDYTMKMEWSLVSGP